MWCIILTLSINCRLHTEKRLLKGFRNIFAKPLSPFRLAVLGKLNNFVKEWIAEISELKVGRLLNRTSNFCVIYQTLKPLSCMSRMWGVGGESNLFSCLCFSSRTCHHRLYAVLGARYLHLGHTDLESTQKVQPTYNS